MISKELEEMKEIPRPEYPRPDLVREEWLNLNGLWEFEIDPGRSGRARGLPQAEKLAREILVPFCPESALSGIGYKDFMNAVWYRRTLRIPEEWEDRQILLHIGACDYETHIYLNGKEVGVHWGGYTPITVNLTDFLKPGDNNLVIEAIDDTRSPSQASGKQSPEYDSFGCMYTRTTGIWQTVWLEPVPKTYITRIKLAPYLEVGGVVVEAETNGAPQGLWLRIKAFAEQQELMELWIAANGHRAGGFLTIPDPRPWSPDDPFLYDLEITLEDAFGNVLDRVRSYFGLRSLSWKGPVVLLNGKPLFQRLVLDQGFYPEGIYTAPSDEALKRDILIAKDLGFNGARLHQKVFEPRFLYWADRLGYLCWGEMPSWGLGLRDWLGISRFTQEWIEALQRDYNHPSIVGWCPFNETGPENPDLLRAFYRITKALDPTRPCIDTSGYVHAETDLYDVHDYDQNPETFRTRYQPFAEGGEPFRNNPRYDAPYQNQPYWVSEYGGIWWNPGQRDEKAWGYGGPAAWPRTEEEFLERYRQLTETLLFHPRICAFCYTQLYDVEQEVNGLYTYDRKPKFNPEKIRAINQQKAAIED